MSVSNIIPHLSEKGYMLSGVADSIYCLNRYIEISENIAHFGEVNFNLILDSPSGITQLFTDLPT